MGYSPPSGWDTDANLARAEALTRAGIGPTEIAKAIGGGCTKHAIIGARTRLQWERPAVTVKPKAVKTVWEKIPLSSVRREAGPDPLPPMSEISWGAIHPISWVGFDVSLGDD